MLKEVLLIFVLFVAFLWFFLSGGNDNAKSHNYTSCRIDKPINKKHNIDNRQSYLPGSRVRFAPTANERTYDKASGEIIGSRTVAVN